MGRSTKSVFWTVGAVIGVGLAVPAIASAQHTSIVTPTITPLIGGGYTYSYSVENSPTSTANIGVVIFDIDDNVTASNLVYPAGYLSLYTPNQTPVEFDSALQPDGSNADITPGMADTFSFTSISAPGSIDYATQSFDDGSVSSGFTLGPTPAPVPEPATIGVIAIGATMFLRRKTDR